MGPGRIDAGGRHVSWGITQCCKETDSPGERDATGANRHSMRTTEVFISPVTRGGSTESMTNLSDLTTTFERGSAHYQQIGYARRIGYGSRPALLIIDMAKAWTL